MTTSRRRLLTLPPRAHPTLTASAHQGLTTLSSMHNQSLIKGSSRASHMLVTRAHQTLIKRSSSARQAFATRSSRADQALIMHTHDACSSSAHQALIRRSSSAHQALVVSSSSARHQLSTPFDQLIALSAQHSRAAAGCYSSSVE